jgi:hypothetical protein
LSLLILLSAGQGDGGEESEGKKEILAFSYFQGLPLSGDHKVQGVPIAPVCCGTAHAIYGVGSLTLRSQTELLFCPKKVTGIRFGFRFAEAELLREE